MRLMQIPRGTVVVGVDGSDHSIRALDWAADLAAGDHHDLTVLHACDPYLIAQGGPWAGWGGWHELRTQAQAICSSTVTSAVARAQAAHPDIVVHAAEDVIDARTALVSVSEHAHLIVLGSRGRGPVTGVLLGSVCADVARRAGCPVVAVPEHSPAEHAGVVVVVDHGRAGEGPVEWAFEQAAAARQPLRVVRCVDPVDVADEDGEAERRLHDLCVRLHEKHHEVELVRDFTNLPVEQALVDATLDADLTVLERAPRRGLERLLHHTIATTVLEHAHGPVAVIPERKQ